jgi:hypothetical protein
MLVGSSCGFGGFGGFNSTTPCENEFSPLIQRETKPLKPLNPQPGVTHCSSSKLPGILNAVCRASCELWVAAQRTDGHGHNSAETEALQKTKRHFGGPFSVLLTRKSVKLHATTRDNRIVAPVLYRPTVAVQGIGKNSKALDRASGRLAKRVSAFGWTREPFGSQSHAYASARRASARSHLGALEAPTSLRNGDHLPGLQTQLVGIGGCVAHIRAPVAEILPLGQRRRLLRACLGHHELASATTYRTAHQKHRRNPDSLGHDAGLADRNGGQKGCT